MRSRPAPMCLWAHASSRLSCRVTWLRTYSAHSLPPPPPPPGGKGGAEMAKERVVAALQHAGELGRQWGQRSAEATTATVNYWWGRYEEFVGLVEVRDAQAKVTEAESAFMVSRGMVREAHGSLEALQVRLKEVRDRLDRVSREEAHYLELATLEHRLLQEERRLRTAYASAEGSEREKFGLFSAAVRESHEKERTRAERTKNWSIVGSVLGALIGVMGSTYVNRVRLQELRTLLLEAQKGPESLQEALKLQAGSHRSQQAELQALIDSLRVALSDAFAGRADGHAPEPPPAAAAVSLPAFDDLRRTASVLDALPPQLGQLEQGLGRVEGQLGAVRKLLESPPPAADATPLAPPLLRPPSEGAELLDSDELLRRLDATQRTLGERIRTNTLYNAVFAYTAAAVTVSALFLLMRGGG
ncbi:unnamed protein product [Ophioblennius macclurei]